MVLIPWRFYEELSSFTEEMDQLFDRFFGREFFISSGKRFISPPLYFTETQNEIVITLDVPIFSPQELEVTLKEDLLMIKGEKSKNKRSDLDHQETVSFKRTIRFSRKLKEETIQARFREGKLIITIEKVTEKTPAYRVPIE